MRSYATYQSDYTHNFSDLYIYEYGDYVWERIWDTDGSKAS
jgi:hypothetical protein